MYNTNPGLINRAPLQRLPILQPSAPMISTVSESQKDDPPRYEDVINRTLRTSDGFDAGMPPLS